MQALCKPCKESKKSKTACQRQARCKLSVEEQFFLVLVRLRTSASVLDLSHRASISPSTFSKLFTTWRNFLAYELKALHGFPASNPRVLVKSFIKFRETRVIIDCTEVFTERLSGLESRKQLFSNYKHHATTKFLVGISLSGSVLYVSNMWRGRASDKKITMECGLIDLLSPGQYIMADRGFTIEEELREKRIGLYIPSFLGSKRSQLTAEEVTSTRRIAEARTHVVHVIGRIKEFKILCGDLDLGLLHVLEQVFQVCAYLTNFQKPIVKDVIYIE